MSVKNIDEINRGYGWLMVIIAVVMVLQNIYKYLSSQPSPLADWAGLITLVVGYIIIKWLFKKA
jgi:hypothetical protein